MFKLKYILLFVFLTSCSTEHPVNFDVSVSDSDILKTLNIENTNNKITNTWYYIFEDKSVKPKAVLQVVHGMKEYVLSFP